MQVAVIEFTRSVLGLAGANSTEFDTATPTPAVVFMPEGSTTHKGGTMRLGTRRTLLETVDCITAKLYQVRAFSLCMQHSSDFSQRMSQPQGWHAGRAELDPTWSGHAISMSLGLL